MEIPFIGLIAGIFFPLPLYIISLSQGIQSGLTGIVISIIITSFLLGSLTACAYLAFQFIPLILVVYLFLKKNSSEQWTYSLGEVVSRTTAIFMFAIIVGLSILIYCFPQWQDFSSQVFKGKGHYSFGAQEHFNHLMEWLFPLVSLSIIGTCFLNWASAYFILNKYELNLRTIVKKDWVAPFYWDIILTCGIMVWIAVRFLTFKEILPIAKTVIVLSCIPLAFIGFRICYLRLLYLRNGQQIFRILCLLSFFLVWPITFIVLLGFIEPWYRLTERLSVSQEESL